MLWAAVFAGKSLAWRTHECLVLSRCIWVDRMFPESLVEAEYNPFLDPSGALLGGSLASMTRRE